MALETREGTMAQSNHPLYRFPPLHHTRSGGLVSPFLLWNEGRSEQISLMKLWNARLVQNVQSSSSFGLHSCTYSSSS